MNTKVITIDNREVMMMNIVFLSLLIIAVMIKILGEMI
tara:strand:+ start:352 stop:465 length:114 start_codon:yes stop_codon:yes gene_type:complete